MAKRNTNGLGFITRVGPKSKQLEYQLRRVVMIPNVGKIRIKSEWSLSMPEALESWERKQDERFSNLRTNFTQYALVADVADYVADQTSRGGQAYTRGTINNHKTWANALRRYLGKLQIRHVTLQTFIELRQQLEQPLTRIDERGRKVSWSGRSQQVAMIMWILKESVDVAYRFNVLNRHPLQKMDLSTKKQLFKNNRLTPEQRHAITWTPEEVELILTSMDPDVRQKLYWYQMPASDAEYYAKHKHHRDVYFHRILHTIAETGLRVGEVAGLQWKHIYFGDKENDRLGTIYIEQQVSQATAPIFIKEPKTVHGNRWHPMTWELNDLLLMHKKQWNEDRLHAPTPFNWGECEAARIWREKRGLPQEKSRYDVPAEGVVFPSIEGNFRSQRDIQERMTSLAQKLGIYTKWRNTHGFRRKIATERLPYIHAEHLARLLGHSPNYKATTYEYANTTKNAGLDRESMLAFKQMIEKKEAQ